MTKEERTVMLEEARELISEALGMIREATEEDAHVEAYLCAPLSLLIDEGTYVSYDITIEWVIERISEDGVNMEEEEEEEEEEDDDGNMANIDDERGRGHIGRTGQDEDDQCGGCGSALNTAPPCPIYGEKLCQNCAGHHVCNPE